MKYLLLIALVSCGSATMKKSPGEVSRYAPKNYKEKGVVEYLNAGASWVKSQRREDAYKKMHEACNGDYTIDREGNKAQFNAINTYEQDTWVIEFSCNSVAVK